MSKKIKVLVVDDQALVRQTMTEILESDPDIEVMATAADPYAAAEKLRRGIPDVITLDIEMPRMDGLTFLRKIMGQHPIPVIICSSMAESGSDNALKALEYGAVEIVTKPKVGTKKFLEESRIRLCDAVKAAARVRPRKKDIFTPSEIKVRPKLDADVVIAKGKGYTISTTEKMLVVGASTGGTEALSQFLQALPLGCPAVAIVQHMPEGFTARFSERLNQICRITVKEAQDNDTMLRGQALIAPGNKHLLLKRAGARYYVQVKDGPLVSRHRPSVDVLFRSAAQYAGKNAVGAIMTGMGDDGAKGMKELFEAGGWTIAQDEATSVVFGMPKEAIRLGGVREVLPLGSIAPEMVRRALAGWN
ncbi:MAG: chemotaxis response regulator protein-glutamate methylesterase [Desulfovibrio sp.]|jgi:two-component system chemotaxis response regulator CheB